jgi:D-alanyl-lipoteichoic acid acyltransferase DltB (MBOAT superfamily)
MTFQVSCELYEFILVLECIVFLLALFTKVILNYLISCLLNTNTGNFNQVSNFENLCYSPNQVNSVEKSSNLNPKMPK